jgi:methylenetetrahydrofolate reductase (NADPH)
MNEGVGLEALRARLEKPCFEIMPLKGIEARMASIPPGSDVAIMCSPSKGIAATLDLAGHLRDRGFTPIPHIAARMIVDEVELREILGRLDELEIRRVFVIAGDAERPAGRFDSSLDLLELMAAIDHGIEIVGIGAYPEGHPLLGEETLLSFLQNKQPFAAYMTTQICFDPEIIVRWLHRVRAEGIDLPVHIGVRGVVDRTKLLRIALKIGVGQSARFLKSNLGLVGRMIAPGGYSPDELLLALAPYFDTQRLGIEGVHFYTFNQIESTEEWRAVILARLRSGGDRDK